MPRGKAGRPKGTPNKRSQKLLNMLEERNFSIVGELLELYQYDKQIYLPIIQKLVDNKPLDEGEEDRLRHVTGEMKSILFKLIGYCYPKLKAMEIQAGAMDRVTFNFTQAPRLDGGHTEVTDERGDKVIDVTFKPKRVPAEEEN